MKKLVALFFFLAISLVSLILFVGVSKIKEKPVLAEFHPHLYENKEMSLKKISITVFYFVPKDITIKEQDSWKKTTEEYLKKVIEFHSLQFKNTSKISYEFFPQIVIGEKTAKEYESFFKFDDHDALVPVKEEITRRVLQKDGDLYTPSVLKSDKNTHNSYMVIFEGKGAAGNGDFCLLSHAYLTDPLYKDTAATFLAHEFYHTLGIPDKYQTAVYGFKNGEQVTVSLPTSKDIMGQVNVPLSFTYIDEETLKKMGL